MDYSMIVRELGLDQLPELQQQQIWQSITNTVEMLVALRFSRILTREQMDRLDALVSEDDEGLAFLDAVETIYPDAGLVVEEAILEYIDDKDAISPIHSSRDYERRISRNLALIAKRERQLGPDHRHTRYARSRLAELYLMAKQPEATVGLCEANLAGCQRTLDGADRETLHAMAELANAYAWNDRYDEAIACGETAVDGFERTLGPDAEETLECRSSLAGITIAAGLAHVGIPMLQSALTTGERVHGPGERITRSIREELVEAYVETGRTDLAVALYQSALAEYEQMIDPDQTVIETLRKSLAELTTGS